MTDTYPKSQEIASPQRAVSEDGAQAELSTPGSLSPASRLLAVADECYEAEKRARGVDGASQDYSDSSVGAGSRSTGAASSGARVATGPGESGATGSWRVGRRGHVERRRGRNRTQGGSVLAREFDSPSSSPRASREQSLECIRDQDESVPADVIEHGCELGDVDGMSVSQLKAKARALGLATTGLKAQLRERVRKEMQSIGEQQSEPCLPGGGGRYTPHRGSRLTEEEDVLAEETSSARVEPESINVALALTSETQPHAGREPKEVTNTLEENQRSEVGVENGLQEPNQVDVMSDEGSTVLIATNASRQETLTMNTMAFAISTEGQDIASCGDAGDAMDENYTGVRPSEPFNAQEAEESDGEDTSSDRVDNETDVVKPSGLIFAEELGARTEPALTREGKPLVSAPLVAEKTSTDEAVHARTVLQGASDVPKGNKICDVDACRVHMPSSIPDKMDLSPRLAQMSPGSSSDTTEEHDVDADVDNRKVSGAAQCGGSGFYQDSNEEATEMGEGNSTSSEGYVVPDNSTALSSIEPHSVPRESEALPLEDVTNRAISKPKDASELSKSLPLDGGSTLDQKDKTAPLEGDVPNTDELYRKLAEVAAMWGPVLTKAGLPSPATPQRRLSWGHQGLPNAATESMEGTLLTATMVVQQKAKALKRTWASAGGMPSPRADFPTPVTARSLTRPSGNNSSKASQVVHQGASLVAAKDSPRRKPGSASANGGSLSSRTTRPSTGLHRGSGVTTATSSPMRSNGSVSAAGVARDTKGSRRMSRGPTTLARKSLAGEGRGDGDRSPSQHSTASSGSSAIPSTSAGTSARRVGGRKESIGVTAAGQGRGNTPTHRSSPKRSNPLIRGGPTPPKPPRTAVGKGGIASGGSRAAKRSAAPPEGTASPSYNEVEQKGGSPRATPPRSGGTKDGLPTSGPSAKERISMLRVAQNTPRPSTGGRQASVDSHRRESSQGMPGSAGSLSRSSTARRIAFDGDQGGSGLPDDNGLSPAGKKRALGIFGIRTSPRNHDARPPAHGASPV